MLSNKDGKQKGHQLYLRPSTYPDAKPADDGMLYCNRLSALENKVWISSASTWADEQQTARMQVTSDGVNAVPIWTVNDHIRGESTAEVNRSQSTATHDKWSNGNGVEESGTYYYFAIVVRIQFPHNVLLNFAPVDSNVIVVCQQLFGFKKRGVELNGGKHAASQKVSSGHKIATMPRNEIYQT